VIRDKILNPAAMNSFFCKITEENKLNLNKPVDSDMVYYSELNEWFTGNAFRSFSVKYVIDNFIHYKAGKKEHLVGQGNFLLACKQPFVKAYFDSEKPVKSICIDIRSETIDEAFIVMTARENYEFDNYLSGYFKFPYFFESVTPVKSAVSFNKQLNALVEDTQLENAQHTVNKEWFLQLVEGIIYHEYGNFLALNGIRSVRSATKKEILHRLKTGKQYIDDNFLLINDIVEVATVSNMSEFHFFRSFKQAFSISPYKYLLKKKLELSRSLLSERKLPINKIAAYCSFSDLPAFSKAFKRQYGKTPSQFHQ
jgi:AraC family transcriptional regulator